MARTQVAKTKKPDPKAKKPPAVPAKEAPKKVEAKFEAKKEARVKPEAHAKDVRAEGPDGRVGKDGKEVREGKDGKDGKPRPGAVEVKDAAGGIKPAKPLTR